MATEFLPGVTAAICRVSSDIEASILCNSKKVVGARTTTRRYQLFQSPMSSSS